MGKRWRAGGNEGRLLAFEHFRQNFWGEISVCD